MLHDEEECVFGVSHLKEFYDIGMVQGLHGVDFSERSIGPVPINDFDSHLCRSQNVLGQLHLGRSSLTSVVQELVAPNAGLLLTRDGCKIM